MRTCLRLSALLILCAIATPPPTPAMPPPPQMTSACFSVTSSPCPDCPGIRSKSCLPDPSGLFQYCTESSSSCDGVHNCTQVQTGSGPACGN